jgi:hypothetical protein
LTQQASNRVCHARARFTIDRKEKKQRASGAAFRRRPPIQIFGSSNRNGARRKQQRRCSLWSGDIRRLRRADSEAPGSSPATAVGPSARSSSSCLLIRCSIWSSALWPPSGACDLQSIYLSFTVSTPVGNFSKISSTLLPNLRLVDEIS